MKTNRVVTLMLLSLCVTCCLSIRGFSQVQPLGAVIGNQTVIQVPISAANNMSQALLYLPDDYYLPQNANKRYPLFVFLHGTGEGSSNNITQVTNTSLPQLIAQGLKPYGIDSVTGDTLKFIVVSPHAALTNYSYSYPQLRWIIPNLFNTYRVDTTCAWVGGLSAGGRGTWSCVMEDTVLAKKLAGIMPVANGGYDNEMTVDSKRQNLDSNVLRGLAVLTSVGTQDPGYLGSITYRDTVNVYARPRRSFYNAVLNGAHNSGVWNPPFTLAWRGFNPTKNSWDIMANIHRTAAPASTLGANAGGDQFITLPVSIATLSGSASTPAGTTISSYAWSQISGPAAIITTPGSASTTVTALVQGTYVFRLTVTNNLSATSIDDVSITVNAAVNQPPVVNAGSNQAITLPTNSVTLSGSGSDPNGTISSYQWTKLTGGAATIATPSAAVTPVTGLAQGSYTFRLTATDNQGASSYSDVGVTVNAAAAGSPGTITVKKVGCTEYRVSYLFSDSTCRSIYYNAVSGKTELMPYYLNGRKVIDVAMGFNVTAMLDDQGYPWVSRTNLITVDRVDTDTLGNAFNNNTAIYGYFYTYITIKADGSLWYWGGNDYKLGSGATISKPFQLSPAGLQFKKVAMGSTIVALTTTGEIYEWYKSGSLVPSKRTTPRPAIDIFSSQYNFRGCLIPNAGAPDQTTGYPYVWGGDFTFWGGSAAYAEPTSVTSLWNVTAPIKEIAANQNTVHYIDNIGRMFGIGDNANGEIGNGQELVNHADLYKTPYNWSWVKGELYTGAPPQQIAAGTQFKQLFTSNTFNFYMYAQDANDSVYFWGRNKSMLGGDGVGNFQASNYPNALDVLAPKLVSPLGILPTSTVYYTFTPYTINGGVDQTISAGATTLSGSATPSTLTASGKPTITYSIVGYNWTQIAGPGCTINSPTSATTTISGLTTGTYKFQFKMTDNHTGTIADTVTVFVNTVPPNTPPVANAGANQSITLPVSTVTVTGSGTDADGTIASYQWTKISGPASFSIMTPTQASTIITGLVQGTYVFRLTVTDNAGATGYSDVTITVNAAPPPPNVPPAANAGTDFTITLPVNNVTFNGSGTDVDGSIISYSWTKINGPGSYSIASSTQAQTAISSLVQGVYTFRLVVTDNLGATAYDDVQVTVNAAPNAPPAANAGGDLTITLPVNSVTLNGSGTDADGTISSYSWIKISGPGSYSIATSTQAQTAINNLIQGVYTFRLTVTDNSGATAYDDVQVTVNPAPNVPPVANAGADITITLPVSATTLMGSATDQDGTIISYQWTYISGPSSYSIVDASFAQTIVGGLTQGVYVFRLTATDNSGAVSQDDVQVTVNAGAPPPPGNQAPVANAGADGSITLPTNSFGLNGNGFDADGTIASYQWTIISGPAGSTIANSGLAQTTANNMAEGVYVFQLKVTDDLGAIGTDTVVVTVNPAPANIPPVANAGADINITLPVNSSSLDGSGIDTDGSIASYSWVMISGPASYIIGDASIAQTSVTGLTQGVYQFELTVTDNRGAVARDTVTITVNAAPPPPANIPPAASAGSDATITLPVNTAILNGSGSDADGSVVSYAWAMISGPSSYTIANASIAQTSVTGLTQGVYQFELIVTDDRGATARDTVVITVNAAPPPANIPPTASAGSNISITLPVNSVTLNGSGADTDGTIVSYQWTQISGPASFTIVSESQAQTVINNLVEGVYTFRLTVTDNSGATATSNVQVIVNAPAPPANVVPVANAGSDITITLPVNSVTLNGVGTDADGSIVAMRWAKISGPALFTFGNANAGQTNVTNLIQGIYQFELTVTDNSGATATDIVTVTVNAAVVPPPANKPPVAFAGADQTITLPVNQTIVNGSGTDSDGSVVSYSWTRISGPSEFSIVTPAQAISNINNMVEGVYEFELKVTDNQGAVGRDTVRITVLPDTKVVSTASLYPNPATTTINLKIEAVTHRNYTTVKIYDERGMVVYQEEFMRTDQVMVKTINVSNLPAGAYFLLVGADINKDVTLKFIKQ